MLSKFQSQPDGILPVMFSPEVFSDDATKERIRRHLINPFDVISDEDIRNVKTEMNVPSEIVYTQD